ncbi:LLM class F420-dependent oxidoreductase [Kutzneria sp. NPDC052558]|uniref:LLM class F420-dependent oxidoreductase n=1 Tax=Kutzneria sp. NPDC052558 TaxID=3364121 RepID=UPI0037CB8009
MRIGLAVADYAWPGGTADTLREVAAAAEDGGFASIAVMDHLWQIPVVGRPEQEMLEAYATLGFLAACTSRIELLTLVTAAIYRAPALLAKALTTVDVLSGGRSWLGIGVGSPINAAEAAGLGLPFPELGERFERLAETLEICRRMWSENEEPFHGKHYTLGRTLNSPQPVRRPPILIGGSGERTLRLVAEYGDACNLFVGPDLERKLNTLRRHCDQVGRDYDEIAKTVLYPLDPGAEGRNIPRLLADLTWLAGLGVDTVHGPVPAAHEITPLELLGRHVIPAVAAL